jgi:molybdopterin-guanine dinucleotide biosynthesis protein A
VISKEHEPTGQPPLYGLVLAGGKSVRMGHDKGTIGWHGMEQRYYMAGLLESVCNDVFISCRAEQQSEIDSRYKILPDSYSGSGPLIAILSAFRAQPNAAWLVTACDLPLLDATTLQYLVAQRDASAMATTFESPFDKLPEPLITIWEPASVQILESFFSDNFTCPRKVLIRNSDRVKILTPPNPDALMNANTPEDAEKVRQVLGHLKK